MKAPYPAPVTEWHNAPYAAISPTLPTLSHAGQTIIITGGGSGIGRAASLSYAQANAGRIVLLGRREEKLKESAALIAAQSPDCKVETYTADVKSVEDMKRVAKSVGVWDVLILSAGRSMGPKDIADTDPTVWWDVMQTNLQGYFNALHVLLPTRNPSARIIGVSAGLVALSAIYPPCQGASAYVTSKLAQIRLLEHAAAEHSDLYVVSVHPGIVASDLQRESAMTTEGSVEAANFDDVNLAANWFVWASSPEGAFLRGKFAFANWDVVQLKERTEEIKRSLYLTPNIVGWPFEPKA